VCVTAETETKPAWDSFLKNPHFVPKQNAVLELKKLMPVKNKVNIEHLATVHGTGLTATQNRRNKKVIFEGGNLGKAAGAKENDVCDDQSRPQSQRPACKKVL
jgi:hypothetical protein